MLATRRDTLTLNESDFEELNTNIPKRLKKTKKVKKIKND